jgi:nucleotide-binding universal stress UspA family protein
LRKNSSTQKNKKGESMTPRIKKILYATDLSENSAYAFYYAIDLAKKNNASIVILHAVEPISPAVMPYFEKEWIVKVEKENITENIGQIKDRLQNFCQTVEGQVGSPCLSLVSKTLVPLGHPTEEILNAANKENCDLIVIGSHGKGFLAHTFLGSVSSEVLHRTRKPVFIVPLPAEKPGVEWGKI